MTAQEKQIRMEFSNKIDKKMEWCLSEIRNLEEMMSYLGKAYLKVSNACIGNADEILNDKKIIEMINYERNE